MPRPERGRLDLADLAVLAVLLATAGLLTVDVLHAPPVIGVYQDDGVYLVTAQALALGRGYRHLELPGEPYQTKYPPLYPLLLSLAWRLFPALSGCVAALQIMNSAAWAAGSWIAYRLMRRLWGGPWWVPALGVLLAYLNGATLGLIQTAMSEPLYFLLSMAALAVLSPAQRDQPAEAPRPPGMRRAAAAGLLAASAYLTRSVGLTLILALVIHSLLGRRWRPAAVMAGIGVLAVAGWQGWCAHAAAVNAAHPASAALRYDLDYTCWLPDSVTTMFWVAYLNLSALPVDFLVLLVPPPHDWITRALEGGWLGRLPLYGALLGLCAVILIGLAGTWRRTRSIVHMYLLLYFAMVLIWPFGPARFLVAVLPILLTLLLAGTRMLGLIFTGRLTRPGQARPGDIRARRRARPAHLGRVDAAGAVSAGLVLLLAGTLACQSLWLVVWKPGRPQMERARRDLGGLVELLRARTPPEAVISATYGGYLYLRSGRKVVPFLPLEDPVPHNYPPDRRFSQCGRVRTPGGLAADAQLTKLRLMDYLGATGAGYVVAPRIDSRYGIAFGEFRRTRPECLELIAAAGPYHDVSSEPQQLYTYYVYRVAPPQP